jgi:hypothetical protein
MYFTGKYDGPSIEEFIKWKSQYGKRSGNFVYTIVSKKMLSYGGNHLTIAR